MSFPQNTRNIPVSQKVGFVICHTRQLNSMKFCGDRKILSVLYYIDYIALYYIILYIIILCVLYYISHRKLHKETCITTVQCFEINVSSN